MSTALWLILGLLSISVVLLVVGIILVVRESGTAKRHVLSDDEAAGIAGNRSSSVGEPAIHLADDNAWSTFHGQAVGVSGEAEISVSQLVEAVREGRGWTVMPWLVAISGFLGILLLLAPLFWITIGPWAGVGWLLLLIVPAVQGYRNRNKRQSE